MKPDIVNYETGYEPVAFDKPIGKNPEENRKKIESYTP